MSDGTITRAMFRRAGNYVGPFSTEEPADLPVSCPEFDLVINLKTARRSGSISRRRCRSCREVIE